MKYGIANKVNHGHAILPEIYNNWQPNTYANYNQCVSDTGVFTMKNYPNEQYNGGEWECQLPKSTTMIVGGNAYNGGPSCCIGGLNMNTSDSLPDCDFFAWTRGYDYYGRNYGWLSFQKNSSALRIYPHNNVVGLPNNNDRLYKTLSFVVPKDAHAMITADKIEIVYSSDDHDYCYLTGVSMAITYEGNIVAKFGEIISRVLPAEQDYINDTPENAICMGSVYFDASNGRVERYITGTGLTSSASSSIHQAFDDTIMSSNTGVAAVSCMVTTDGMAKWLGYKNCVYRLYQGNTPLLGVPNERVVIKGHEFVCPAYGSYYVRMS